MNVSLAGRGLTDTASPKSPNVTRVFRTVRPTVSVASSRLTRPCRLTSTVPVLLSRSRTGPGAVKLAVNAYAVPVQPGSGSRTAGVLVEFTRVLCAAVQAEARVTWASADGAETAGIVIPVAAPRSRRVHDPAASTIPAAPSPSFRLPIS